MKYALIGNSGSGKSTYARFLSDKYDLPHLDLDQIAWEADAPTTLRPTAAAAEDVMSFCRAHEGWIVEGCYAELIQPALELNPHLLLLDPGEAQCLANCRNRPWEPSKYSSKAAQDKNLKFLLNWVSDYYGRDGQLSHAAHMALFDRYDGIKEHLTMQPSI